MNSRQELVKEFTMKALERFASGGRCLDDVYFGARTLYLRTDLPWDAPTHQEVQNALRSLKRSGKAVCRKVKEDLHGDGSGKETTFHLWFKV